MTSRRQLRGLLLAGLHPVDLDHLTPHAGGTLLAALADLINRLNTDHGATRRCMWTRHPWEESST
ncbi:MAG TPA: hypothetical protein VJT49_04880 [Amycolatopsis sp.]|uniref:hypothetical protein n=1 Tax=Amycolatopsis sp. TaxID=37632 RepID=UPI002B475BD0|nr:hypothetical protein [Amycolatopsis sp.]HKS44443.1 hypothetical protein [Amycolatopsis sp.]